MAKGRYNEVPNILIVGPSGTGKSSSARNMDKHSTGVLNLQRKKMPFPGKFKNEIWVPEKPNRFSDDEGNLRPADVLREAKDCLGGLIGDPAIDCIFYESLDKHDQTELASSRIAYTGFDIWNAHNQHMRQLLDRTQDVGKPIIFTSIDEVVLLEGVDESKQVAERRCRILGRELEGTIESHFTIVLHTMVEQVSEEEIEYRFVTNNDGERSAKTPAGMFDDLLIDNDLAMVLDRVQEYYSEPAPRASKRKRSRDR